MDPYARLMTPQGTTGSSEDQLRLLCRGSFPACKNLFKKEKGKSGKSHNSEGFSRLRRLACLYCCLGFTDVGLFFRSVKAVVVKDVWRGVSSLEEFRKCSKRVCPHSAMAGGPGVSIEETSKGLSKGLSGSAMN